VRAGLTEKLQDRGRLGVQSYWAIPEVPAKPAEGELGDFVF
jgi:hypothetical protein